MSSPTNRNIAKALRDVRAGIAQLRSLRPPSSDAAAYARFLSSLDRLFARVGKQLPLLVRLTKELERALPRRVSVYGPGTGGFRRLRRLEAQEARDTRPLILEGAAVAKQGRALGLRECAKNLG